jgi:hypothetical protein
MTPALIVSAIQAAMADLEGRRDHPAPLTVCAYRPRLRESALCVDITLRAEDFKRLFVGEVVTVEQSGRHIRFEYLTPDGTVRYTTHEMGPRPDSVITHTTL